MVRLPQARSVRSYVHSSGAGKRSASPAMCALAIAAALTGGCSSAGNTEPPGSGGSQGSSSGGQTGSGGSSSGSGGTTTSGSGGTAASGGKTGGMTGGSGGGSSGAGGAVASTGGSSGAASGGSTGMTGSGGKQGGSGGSGTAGAGPATGGSTGGAGKSGSGGAPGTAGSSGTGNTTGGGNVYNPNFVEFYGSDCPAVTPADVMVSGQLPNLFTKLDGTTMSKKSDWKCRRAEMKAVVEKYIHGPKPPAPDMVTGSVSASAIKVHAVQGSKSIDFSVSVTMPSGATGPVPIIIGLGGSSLQSSIVSGEGVAQGNYDHQGMMSESSKTGLFTTLYGTSTGASAQIGWAWGFSRIIDVLVSEKAAGRNNIIDPTAVGVTGCSRNGKGAFTVGAFDERIALGIPQESGTGGVSAFRIVNTNPKGPNGMTAQSLSNAVSTAGGWFSSAFESTYINKVDTIPGDTHSLAAMHAPRGLLVLDNSRIGELCAPCQHAATAAAQVVYQALGIGMNVAYSGGNPSDPQDHCSFYPDTQGDPLKAAIRAHLTKTMPPAGKINPQPAGTADLTKWVPWSATAPTLTDDVSWASPPLTKQ